jgi:hypothetical protein
MKNVSILLLFALLIFSSCGTLLRTDFRNGFYHINKKDYARLFKDSMPTKQKYARVEVVENDSVVEFHLNDTVSTDVSYKEMPKIRLFNPSFDIDVLYNTFKIRPPVDDFPAQFDQNINAILYLGYRFDETNFKKSNSRTQKYYTRSKGFGFGGFIGLGATPMSEFVTQPSIKIQYDGLLVSYGVAAMYDFRRFNVGISLGQDNLTDANKSVWIYQNKPWMGVLFGINLN